jgi:hypothetical protein
VPCSDPNAIPPMTTWQCRCTSGMWSCTVQGMNKNACPNPDM